MVEEAHKDLLIALKFDPGNDEVRRELTKIEDKCNSVCRKGLMEEDTHVINSSIEVLANPDGTAIFNPLKFGNLNKSTQRLDPGVKNVDRKRDLDSDEWGDVPSSKRSCQGSNSIERVGQLQHLDLEVANYECQDMVLDSRSCEQASSLPLDSNTTTSVEDRVDSSPTQSPAITKCLNGLGKTNPMALCFSYKNKKCHRLQFCQKSYGILCQGQQLNLFHSQSMSWMSVRVHRCDPLPVNELRATNINQDMTLNVKDSTWAKEQEMVVEHLIQSSSTEANVAMGLELEKQSIDHTLALSVAKECGPDLIESFLKSTRGTSPCAVGLRKRTRFQCWLSNNKKHQCSTVLVSARWLLHIKSHKQMKRQSTKYLPLARRRKLVTLGLSDRFVDTFRVLVGEAYEQATSAHGKNLLN